MKRSLPIVKLKMRKEAPLKAGHPWVFSNAVAVERSGDAGALVAVISARGEFLGIGMHNPNNSIRVRIISRDEQAVIDQAYFESRFAALSREKKLYLPPATTGYRLAHGDADALPGLIVDVYGDVIVFQIHTAGMERFRDTLIQALRAVFSPRAIVERSDVAARKREGLGELPAQVHSGVIDGPVLFQENGLIFSADVMNGQKTGFFLDQRDARAYSAGFARGKTVLNLFGYTGAFSVYAAHAGAKKVITVDCSQTALDAAARHFEMNRLDVPHQCVMRDIFEGLRNGQREEFGAEVIICDPPALAKSQAARTQALRAYSAVNAWCFSLLGEGGILVSSSCSGRVSAEDFRDALRFAAGAAKRNARVINFLGHPHDHTDTIAFPEGRYLKTMVLEVIGVL